MAKGSLWNIQSWVYHILYELYGGTLYRSNSVGSMNFAGKGLHVRPSLNFNAGISRSNKVIHVNLGTIASLTNLSVTISEDRNFVKAILTPASSTSGTPYSYEWHTAPFSQDPDIVDEWFSKELPQIGSEQWFVFTNLFYGALRYVLIHEQAHFLQGHLAFVSQLGFTEDFLELGEDDSEQLSSIQSKNLGFRRILEHDADNFAFHFLLRPFMPYLEGASRDNVKQKLLEGYPRFVATFSGACLCFAAFAHKDRVGSHPSALFRFRQAIINMQNTINFKNDFEYDELDRISALLVPATVGVFSKFMLAEKVVDTWKTVGEMPENHHLAGEREELILLKDQVLPQLKVHQENLRGEGGYLFWGGVQP